MYGLNRAKQPEELGNRTCAALGPLSYQHGNIWPIGGLGSS